MKKVYYTHSFKLLFFFLIAGMFTQSAYARTPVNSSVSNNSIAPPTITSLSPASGPVGTLITITGTNFGNLTGFDIGGKLAVVISNSGTQLVGLVMPGAATGAVIITTSLGEVFSSSNFTVTATSYPSMQQGSKLVGTGATGASEQAASVAVSADGNTAAVYGPTDGADDGDIGAVWIFVRSGGTWVQQGAKLVGTGHVGPAGDGVNLGSMALSADGNTVLVSNGYDNGGTGAAWVFTRSGGTWSQQGDKLVAIGNSGGAGPMQVALSASGNTAVVSHEDDNSEFGAVWVFTRSGSIWTQQGNKLLPSDNTGAPLIGYSVAISADGTTIMAGGRNDNNFKGAAWIFTLSGGAWTQQGSKLVSTGLYDQGWSVALSADGNTAVEGAGAVGANTNGAVSVYTRGGGAWTLQGANLVGTGFVGNYPYQGTSVAVSADGNTLIEGVSNDNGDQGAIWVFTRSAGVWAQQGAKFAGTGVVSPPVAQGVSVALSGDGTTMVEGGFLDNGDIGAAWVFTAASNNAALASLSISSGTLSPAFATGTINYTASVGNTITSITIKSTTSDPTATVTVNGVTVTSGLASAAIPLNVGANVITTIVTAQDGTTTNTYTIVVTRALPAAPNISYGGPQTYTAGIAITALSPVNAGGAVPVAAYGKTSTFYQGNGGTLNGPQGIAVDAQGNVYSSAHHTIYKITPAGVISVLAGSGVAGNNNAQGALASFNAPIGIAVDGQGNVYVADSGNNLIREISPAGLVTTLAGNGVAAIKNGPNLTASFNDPAGVAVDNVGNVYVADLEPDASGNYGLRKISPAGMVSTIANPTSQFGGTWGTGNGAVNPLNFFALTVDAAGNVYVTGGNSGVIDKITPTGVVSTFAGNFGVQSELDGTPDKATFSNPVGLAADAAGNLYVSNNSAVRKVTPQGIVSTLAGLYPNQGSTDGTGASATFSLNPGGVAVDGQGNVYLADNGNLSIRKISAVGYALNTSLPQGLAFDATKGAISGTPGAASPATNYSISAYNLGGSSSAALNITVGTSANLAKLVLSAGTLSPVFATNTSSYTASVANTVTSITLTPTASDATATITVNSTAVKSAQLKILV